MSDQNNEPKQQHQPGHETQDVKPRWGDWLEPETRPRLKKTGTSRNVRLRLNRGET
jgi:hypothetical protein